MALVLAGMAIYPPIFLPLSILMLVYLISLIAWLRIQEQKSKKLGLKVIILLPCESWFFQKLALKSGVQIPRGSIVEMHINTSVKYRGKNCEEKLNSFRQDLKSDLKTIDRLLTTGGLSRNTVLTLNTFNRLWTNKTQEILGGTTYRGTVLSQTICNLYTPQKHEKIFNKMFPGCYLSNPGRNNPARWDLTIIERSTIIENL